MALSTMKEKAQAAIASSRIGRAMVQREAPAALSTASSESVFMALSVCATATTRANGTTIGMIDGMISAATSKKVSADWPLSVTRSILASTCVVHTIASVQVSAAKNTVEDRKSVV